MSCGTAYILHKGKFIRGSFYWNHLDGWWTGMQASWNLKACQFLCQMQANKFVSLVPENQNSDHYLLNYF